MNKTSDSDLARMRSDPGVLRLYSSRVDLKRRGNRLEGLCPFHDDSTPSFSVNQRNGEWLFGCFPCKKEGNIFQFLQQIDGIDFSEAVESVRDFLYGDKPQAKSWEKSKADVEQTFKSISTPKVLKTYPLASLKPAEEALTKSTEAIAWLTNRGITLETARQMHVGFKQTLEMAKHRDPDLVSGGWLMFPRVDGDTVVGIKYRSLKKKAFYQQTGMDGNRLFGSQNVEMFEPLFVVEGELDQLTLHQAGYHALSLPSASITPTPEMRDVMMSAGSRILAGDCDDGVGSDIMNTLWSQLQEQTFLLKWPDGLKDANEVLLKIAKGDVKKFKEIVDEHVLKALTEPAPYITSLTEAMTSASQSNLKDHPLRLRMPWEKVDSMAILLPGSVLGVMATNSGFGKTTWVSNLTIHGARKYNEVVLNYQCELGVPEFVTLVASHLLRKDRNHLVEADYQEAQRMLEGVRYYVGRNPNLATVEPTLDLIEDAIRRLGVTTAVLDNLHFICRNEENEVQAQANAMQRIKRMAQKYGVKFIVVGQPRKAKQDNRGKQTHLTDWRGSAAGVDDADALFTLHRKWLRSAEDNPEQDEYDPLTTVKRLKARACGDGPAGAQLMFHGEIASFSSIVSEQATDMFGSGELL